jgi:hypothetical protein
MQKPAPVSAGYLKRLHAIRQRELAEQESVDLLKLFALQIADAHKGVQVKLLGCGSYGVAFLIHNASASVVVKLRIKYPERATVELKTLRALESLREKYAHPKNQTEIDVLSCLNNDFQRLSYLQGDIVPSEALCSEFLPGELRERRVSSSYHLRSWLERAFRKVGLPLVCQDVSREALNSDPSQIKALLFIYRELFRAGALGLMSCGDPHNSLMTNDRPHSRIKVFDFDTKKSDVTWLDSCFQSRPLAGALWHILTKDHLFYVRDRDSYNKALQKNYGEGFFIKRLNDIESSIKVLLKEGYIDLSELREAFVYLRGQEFNQACQRSDDKWFSHTHYFSSEGLEVLAKLEKALKS